MLAGPCLRDHPRLAHAPGKQRLANGVVDLVRTGVVEILALQVDLGPAQPFRPVFRVVHRTGTADIVFEFVIELRDEFRIAAVMLVGRLQLVQRVHQGFGHEHAAVFAEMPVLVGKLARKIVDLHALPPI